MSEQLAPFAVALFTAMLTGIGLLIRSSYARLDAHLTEQDQAINDHGNRITALETAFHGRPFLRQHNRRKE